MKRFMLVFAVLVGIMGCIAFSYAGTGACTQASCTCTKWVGSDKTLSNDCTTCGHGYNSHK